MAVEVLAITCPAKEYTLIAENKANLVGCQLRGKDAARIAVAGTKPAASEPNYFSLRPDTALSAGFSITSGHGLAGSEKFWLMPETANAVTVEVVRG